MSLSRPAALLPVNPAPSATRVRGVYHGDLGPLTREAPGWAQRACHARCVNAFQDWLLVLLVLVVLAVYVVPLLPWARLRSIRVTLPWLNGAMEFDPSPTPQGPIAPPPVREEREERTPEPTEGDAAHGELRYRIASDER